MKNYYILRGDLQQGPFSLGQLKDMRLRPTVPVWTEGLEAWVQAQTLSELHAAIFLSSSFNATKSESKSLIARFWKKILAGVAVLIVGYFLLAFTGSGQTASVAAVTEKTEEERNAELVKKEKADPSAHISGRLSWKAGRSNEIIVEGTLINTAILADYKDPQLSITTFSKDGQLLDTKSFTVTGLLQAGKMVEYSCKFKTGKKPANVKAVVVGVTE